MADFTIENRQIKPAVFPIFQNENDTTVLKFELDNYIHDDSVDLRNYKAYAVVSVNGLIDMTELASKFDEESDTLTVEWNVQEYSLRESGAIQYQIVFKEDAESGENTGVYYTYKAILMNRVSINADDHITANYPTLLKQWLDRIAQLTGDANKGFVYIPYGESIPPSERLQNAMYWQWDDADETTGHFEDYNGNLLTFSQYSERTKHLTNQDLLGEMTNHADQNYISTGSAIKNAPISNSYCLVKQYDTDSTNRFIQEVQIPDNNNVVRTFVRCITGDKKNGIDKVGEWRELVSSVSPNFTGTPTAPTAPSGAKTTQIANTTFVTNAISNAVSIAMPTGSIIMYAANKTPEGFLLCNGSAVSRTKYSALFSVIGTTYGSGDGSTTFNLPNFTDRFAQGSNTAGTKKEAGLPNITGAFGCDDMATNVQTGAFKGVFDKYLNDTTAEGGDGRNVAIEMDASRCSSVYGKSDTVQPPALTVRFCIKY